MPWEERKPGIVAVVLPDGSSRQVADDVWFPNGMVVLGDDTLVVAESHADRLTAWTITDAGELVDRRVWADLGPGSAPDGICADAEGAIWYASVPGQRCTRVAEGGEVLDTIDVDRGCFACMLGGDDGRTLFIVANHYTGGGALRRDRADPTRRRPARRATLTHPPTSPAPMGRDEFIWWRTSQLVSMTQNCCRWILENTSRPLAGLDAGHQRCSAASASSTNCCA